MRQSLVNTKRKIQRNESSNKDAIHFIRKKNHETTTENDGSGALNIGKKVLSVSLKRMKLSEPQPKMNDEELEDADKEKSEKINSTQVTSCQSGAKRSAKNVLYASRIPLIMRDEILRDFQQSHENLPFHQMHQRHRNLNEEIQNRGNRNSQAIIPKISISQKRLQDLKKRLQDFRDCVNKDDPIQFIHIPKPDHSKHLQVLPTQATPAGQYWKAKLTDHTPSGTQKMEMDARSTDANCIEQECVSSNQSVETLKENDDVNQRSSSPEISEEDTSTADQPLDCTRNMPDLLLDQLADTFEQMEEDFTHACDVASELHQSLVRSAKVMEKISENFRNMRRKNAIAVPLKEVTVGVQNKAEETQAATKAKETSNEEPKDGYDENNDEESRISEEEDSNCGDDDDDYDENVSDNKDDNDDDDNDDDDDDDDDNNNDKNSKDGKDKNKRRKERRKCSKGNPWEHPHLCFTT